MKDFFSLHNDKWPFNEKRAVIVLEVAITVAALENPGSDPYFHWHFYYHAIKIAVFSYVSIQNQCLISLCVLLTFKIEPEPAATADYSNLTCQFAVLF